MDLHFHLLPGVDDGAAGLDESVALAAAASEQGTRTIVTTPHVRPPTPYSTNSPASAGASISSRAWRRLAGTRGSLNRCRTPLTNTGRSSGSSRGTAAGAQRTPFNDRHDVQRAALQIGRAHV